MPSLPLSWAHPLVRDWFINRFSQATEPQVQGWPSILEGKATLIAAPTGSGKTLAAFLACINQLVCKAVEGKLQDRTEVLYVSPLKALSNDIQQNLQVPLREIAQLAEQRGLNIPEIRAAVRTGDTLMPERRAMIKKPPHILVTTPESLYILLTAEKSRQILKDVQTVIVDEIHAVVDDKRGAHLALSLERLEDLANTKPVRIGLSATQKPIEEVAQFLAGNHRLLPVIVNVGHQRKLNLQVEVPASELGPIASNNHWDEIYDRLAELVRQHQSTLVFTNTRKLVERISHQLSQRLGDESVAAHHGSLSRKLRLAAEKKLKSGQVKVVVATASLELGIDVGSIDLVCQIGSPRSIATALQRIGRAGHWYGAIPKGILFATTRDELLECAALVQAISQGDLDRLIIPEAPQDVLAQQIVAICASADQNEDDLYNLVSKAYPYRNLTRESFNELLHMLAEGVGSARARYGAHLHYDQVNKMVRARRGSRLVAITNGGAIPDTALYSVVAEPDGLIVGTLDEDFAVESNRGDIVLLGNTSWRIRRVEAAGRVIVEDAHGAPPNVPFWLGEAPARTAELSSYIANLRQKISDLLPGVTSFESDRENTLITAALAWLKENCHLDQSGAEQAIDYILQGRAVLGAVPTQKTVIAERFFDESGGMQLVVHAPFGGRINKAWGLALRKRFCQSFNLELQAAATDDGFNIALSEHHSFPLADIFNFLHPNSLQHILEQIALQSPIFTTRWRWDATRALALLRFRNGKKVPAPIQRMRSDDLLAAVFPDAAACQDNIIGDLTIPDHPLVQETMKDVLTEAMDLEGLKHILQEIIDGQITCLAVDTPASSAFSHEILNANPYAFLDDAPLEERRARAVEMRRILPESVLQDAGRLDPEAIAEIQDQACPDVRSADELHDLLQTLIALPESINWNHQPQPKHAWGDYISELLASGRVGIASIDGQRFWMAAEKQHIFSAVYPQARFEQKPAALDRPETTADVSLQALMSGWMGCLGPVTADQLSELLRLPLAEVTRGLILLETSGQVLQGHFAGSSADPIEWCQRHLLARIHKLTVGTLRKQIEPVTAAQFMHWLLRWQHLAPGCHVRGERGLLEVLRQLQGFEIPANAWEQQILARRVAGYTPDLLDKLCLNGTIGWGRLSPHPATLPQDSESKLQNTESESTTRRVIPTSVAPITFFLREESDWMSRKHPGSTEEQSRSLSRAARKVFELLRTRGASFFVDLVRASGLLKAEVETALWELVAAGLVTADGFDNLRSLIDPRRRAGKGSSRAARPRHSTGRWSLLYTDEAADHNQIIEATCWMLLKRYGIVFRDLLVRESLPVKWRDLQLAFRRLEDRGEVRGGRFVSGFLGEQFALPVAVESVRAMRNSEISDTPITYSAADPLNLIGTIVPGPRTPAVSSKTVTLSAGKPVSEKTSQHQKFVGAML